MDKSNFATQRARWATASIFFVNGAIMATWVSRIPAIKDELALNDGQLGLALLGIAVGALASFSLAGTLISRLGSRRVMVAAGLVLSLVLLLLPFVPSLGGLALTLVGLGASSGTMDVAMNAQGVEVERQLGRSIMASLHGTFSLGGLTGAVCGSFLARLGWMPQAHFAVAALVAALIIGLSAPRLLASQRKNSAEEPSAVFVLPDRKLLGFGVIACCAFLTEGAMADWTAIYLRDALRTSAAYAAVGFAAFSLTMTIARFCGDALVNRLGAARLVSGGGLLAAVGLTVALIAGQPLLALLGFACVGAGMASIAPVVFSAAGQVPGLPAGTGIAGVATMGYAGFLAGPASIGFLAHSTSIRLALAVVVLPGLLIAFLENQAFRSRTNVSAQSPEEIVADLC